MNSQALVYRALTEEAKDQVEEVEQLVNKATQSSANIPLTKVFKSKIHKLQTNLRQEHDIFIEEFIRLEGISKLFTLLGKTLHDTEVQACALRSLGYCLVYLSGVEYLRKRPQMFVKLFDLVHQSSAIEVKKQVLGIFIGLCKCMKSSFEVLNKAALNSARRNNQSPYASLLNVMSSV